MSRFVSLCCLLTRCCLVSCQLESKENEFSSFSTSRMFSLTLIICGKHITREFIMRHRWVPKSKMKRKQEYRKGALKSSCRDQEALAKTKISCLVCSAHDIHLWERDFVRLSCLRHAIDAMVAVLMAYSTLDDDDCFYVLCSLVYYGSPAMG